MIAELTPNGPIICDLPYTPQTVPLFYWLSHRKGLYGLSRTKCLPHLPNWRDRLRRAIDPAWLGIRPADFALCAGTVAEQHPLIGPTTTILRTCAPDVFRMDDVTLDPPYAQPYAVFLDEGIAEPHRDYALIGRKPPSALQYVKELHEAFDKIGMKVICSYRKAGEGRGTANLVYHAALVLAHSSTAVSFAMLFKKRIGIIQLPCFTGRPEARHTQAMARALNEDYITLYLGTPTAMTLKRRPDELLREYLNG